MRFCPSAFVDGLFYIMYILDPLTTIKGIGQKTAALFEKLGVERVGDLLYFYPRTYYSYPEPLDSCPDAEALGREYAVYARLKNKVTTKRSARLDVTLTSVESFEKDPKKIDLVWYRMPYVYKQLMPGKDYIFYGILKSDGRKLKMEQPKIFTPDEYREAMTHLKPVYPLTKGLSTSIVEKTVDTVLKSMVNTPEEYLPDKLIEDNGFKSFHDALVHLHQPVDFDDLKQARDRLVYNEFFDFFYYGNLENSEKTQDANHFNISTHPTADNVRKNLPFKLTKGQDDTLNEIFRDFSGDTVTQRLIQGDVGSGKTIIAFLAMLACAENGYQTAIMAPTEVLASQHYKTFTDLLDRYGLSDKYRAVLLTGSLTSSQKNKVREGMKSGEYDFVIGTHALFQEKAEYHNLALVVTDEQHRFGVKQREMLTEKGESPFTLVMSATPIPRTLALILYQGMNISVISDVPSERLPIKNALITPDMRQKAYLMIADQVQKGHQAVVICPLVEKSEHMEAENVTDYTLKLKNLYNGKINVQMLHGRMKPEEKDEIMKQFADGIIQVLVSTTVVEVGVNVPNATVMLIENADRFGLAQLHQLRGRVGRGSCQSYCMFVDTSSQASDHGAGLKSGDDHKNFNSTDASGKGKVSGRLQIISHSNDGFFVAEQDLKLRGPGDFFGIRQSGDASFKIADIYQDSALLKKARTDINRIMSDEIQLSTDEKRRIEHHLTLEQKLKFTNL